MDSREQSENEEQEVAPESQVEINAEVMNEDPVPNAVVVADGPTTSEANGSTSANEDGELFYGFDLDEDEEQEVAPESQVENNAEVMNEDPVPNSVVVADGPTTSEANVSTSANVDGEVFYGFGPHEINAIHELNAMRSSALSLRRASTGMRRDGVSRPMVINVDNSDTDSSGNQADESEEDQTIQMLIDENTRTGAMDWRNRHNVVQRMRRLIFGMSSRRANRRSSAGSEEMEIDENIENQAQNSAESAPENAVNFDTNLPAEHSYMGVNMNRVSGVNYLDVGSTAKLMLFKHMHIIFPGEVLPFMTPGPIIEADRNSQNGLLFGIVFPHLNTTDRGVYYGVTFHIYEKGEDDRGNTLVKSRALQRFVVKNSDISGPLLLLHHNTGEMRCHGYVRILPEIYLPEPLKCIDMGCWNRFRDIESMKNAFKLYQIASTPLPINAYNKYSITDIIAKARTKLEQHKIDTMPQDPVQLSYWLVRNLHLPEGIVKEIFLTDSVNIRFQQVLNSFAETTIFTCRHCHNRIANCDQLFAMSKHGVQTQYCNSAGYIHETNTVYRLLHRAVIYVGNPSTEFSWFPGYQWHSISCRMCSHHVGWEFKAVEPNLVPRKFFGISSSSVRVSRPETDSPPAFNTELFQNLMHLARGGMD